jgi:hypothetical protein
MRAALVPLLVVLIATGGCKKKESAQTAPVTQPAPAEATTAPGDSAPGETSPRPSPPSQPAKPPAPPPAYVAARADNNIRQNVNGIPDAFLTTQLRTFMQKHGRLPENFAEFANTTLDSIPRPPEGKKWVIDLDSMQVKAVASP